MKKHCLLLFLFVLGLIILMFPAEAKIISEYDRFKKQTTISTEARPLQMSKPLVSLLTVFPGETPVEIPKDILFIFYVKNKDWKYLRCNETNFLIDDEPLSLGKANHKGDVLRGNIVLESLTFFVTFDIIKKMAEAQKIEYKICNSEFVLSEEELQDLKDFVKIVVPES